MRKRLPEIDFRRPSGPTPLSPSDLAYLAMVQIQGQTEFATREELLHIAQRAMQMAQDLTFMASEDADRQPRRRAVGNYITHVMALAALAGPDGLKYIAWRAGQLANDAAEVATRAGAHRLHLAEQLGELRREEGDDPLPAAA